MRSRALFAVVAVAVALGFASQAMQSAPSADQQVAGRYYIRNRTQNFYNRARPKSHVRSRSWLAASEVEVPAAPANEINIDGTELAGRYYIRNRTRDFYQRATPKSRRHFA
jgi:hypothetical protein